MFEPRFHRERFDIPTESVVEDKKTQVMSLQGTSIYIHDKDDRTLEKFLSDCCAFHTGDHALVLCLVRELMWVWDVSVWVQLNS